jgi:hypothetical protein
MNKWHLRFLRLAYFGLAAILPIYALADYNATQGAGTIFRAFDSTHGGTSLCAAANTQCQGIVNTNSAGAEVGIAAAPLRIDPTGTTTQPVSGTVAATQSGAWTVNPTTAANWGIGTSTYNSALATNGQLALGQFQTSPGAMTTTNMSPLQLDSTGNLRVNVVAGGAGGGAVTAVAGAYATGSIVDLGTTADAVCATDTGTCTLIALTKRTNQNISGPIPAGSAIIGKVGIDQTTPGTTNGVVVNNANSNGRTTAANSSPVVPVAAASTAGAIAPNNTTAVVVKASAGTLFGVQIYGIAAAPAYLKIYNATSATCGSGTPVKRLMIPAAATAANGAGSNVTFGPGLAFATGITYCVTTGITDADTTAVAANTFLINVDYE